MQSTKSILKYQFSGGIFTKTSDKVIVEQPLQISIYGECLNSIPVVYTITYRTPGNDIHLITGLLLSEGVINQVTDIFTIALDDGDDDQNRWAVSISQALYKQLNITSHYQPTYSSCGLCGSTSIKQFESKHNINLSNKEAWLASEKVQAFTNTMRQHQQLFKQTGGNHAAALFNKEGQLVALQEDIGRHNALDKLIGYLASDEMSLSLEQTVLVISSRISLEMVQKALVARIPVIIAVGSASSLAIDAANRFGQTLIGFVQKNGFNIYAGRQRIK